MSLRANLAISLDGKIAPEQPESGSFTSRGDRSRMRVLRAQADAILVGAETLRQANPPLGIGTEQATKRREEGRPEQPTAVLITQSGKNLAEASRFWGHPGRRIVLTTSQGCREITHLADQFQVEVKVVDATPDGMNVHSMLAVLRDEGHEHLLLEGGGATLSAFVRSHLVDQLFVTLAPCLLGGRDAPSLFGGPGLRLPHRVRLKLIGSEVVESELFLVYSFVRPTAP